MSKNLTRKGLAFGALVALGSSVIAGAPANAAVSSLTIAPTYGTSTNTILGQDFNVAISGAGIAGAQNEFKLYVEGAVASDFASTTAVNYRKGVTKLSDGTGVTGVADANDGTVATVSATEKTAVIANITTLAASYTTVKLDLGAAVTATRTIKVTPFVDNIIADGKPTAGEVAGTPISITYYKGSEVTATTTIKAPLIGDTTKSLTALVTLDKDINLAQFKDAGSSDVSVDFKANAGTAVNVANITYSSTDAALKATTTNDSNIGNIAKNTVYSAQAKIGGTASGTISATTVAGSGIDVTTDYTVADFVSATTGLNVRDAGTNTYGVRTGTTSVSLTTAAFKKATSTSDATKIGVGAGLPAKVTVTPLALASGSKFTAGGKSSDTANTAFTFDTTTNADSKVVFDLTAVGAAAGDNVKVDVSILDNDAWTTTSDIDTTYLTWEDATQTSEPVLLNSVVKSGTNNTSVVSVKAGGSFNLEFALYDNFGGLYAGSTSKYVYVKGGSVAKFVAGKATVARTDSNVADAEVTLTYAVGTSSSYPGSDPTAKTVLVEAQKNPTAGFLTATSSFASTKVPGSATFAAGDARNGAAAFALDTADLGDFATVSGKLLNSEGTALKGATATISGAGLLFVSGYENVDDQVWAVGSITVNTNASGDYSVKVYSNKSGKQTVTVTSGAVSATATPEWSAAGATTASAITITAPTSTAPGTTAAIVVKLTDAKGNAVKTDGSTAISFTVRVSGAGTPGTINEYTNADGETRFNVVVGSGETGSFKVTVTYDADKDGVSSAPITKEAVVTIAAAAAPVAVEPTSKIGTANSRVYVNVKDGKGSVVSVKIGNKWFTRSALNNDYTLSFKAAKGKKVSVKVYVDGDLSSSKTITVK
jgi:hypothetical protein